MSTRAARSTPKAEPSSPARPAHAPSLPTANKPAARAVVPKASPVKELAKPMSLRRAAAADVRPPSVKESANPVSIAATRASSSSGDKGLSGEQASKVATASVKAAAAAEQAKHAASPPTSPPMPKTWDTIKVGSLVIAHESVVDGWWEAVVTEIRDDLLTLRWRDYLGLPTITRKWQEIALPYSGK